MGAAGAAEIETPKGTTERLHVLELAIRPNWSVTRTKYAPASLGVTEVKFNVL
jgi:hypothetical protein